MNKIEKLIQDGLWRDISEAPRDVNVIVTDGRCSADAYWWVNDWEPCNVSSGDPELDCSITFKPTHFRPLPDDRLANALKVAVGALKDISMANVEVVDEIVDAALAEIERIAEGGK